MKLAIFLVVYVFNSISCDTLHRISCGSFMDHEEVTAIGNQRTCFIGSDTTIDKRDYQFSDKNDTIKGLNIGDNKRISYLPIYIYEKFPNLLVLSSTSPLRSISKENFRGLTKLRALILSNGKIEKIYSDTFDDLTLLEEVDLRGNRIRYLNILQIFRGFNKLSRLKLRENQCIDENFAYREAFVAWLLAIDKLKCGFCKSDMGFEEELCEMHHKTLENLQYLIEIQNYTCTLPGIVTEKLKVPDKLRYLFVKRNDLEDPY